MANPKQVTTDFTLARTSLIMGAYAIAKNMRQNQPLLLIREPTSKVSPNDVMVVLPQGQINRKIGYLPPGLAEKIAPLMDKGVKVIARKAPNVLYGICQLAFIAPDEPPASEQLEQVIKSTSDDTPLDVEIVPVDNSKVPAAPFDVAVAPLTVLPEGVTQADIDSATDLPPLGDSRRPVQEVTNDEPSAESDETP